MAPHNLLHLLHPVRMVCPDVETCPTAPMGNFLCHRLGHCRNLPSSNEVLLWHDGRAVLPGLL